MTIYWPEIKKFLKKNNIKFTSRKGFYDHFEQRYEYIVSIEDKESIKIFLDLKEKYYFNDMRLVSIKIVENMILG
jgi:hypothetical protein